MSDNIPPEVVLNIHVPPEYVYLLKESEFVKSGENIYKIGKTEHKDTRFNGYKKGYDILMLISCDDCDLLETELKIIFKQKYIQRKDHGIEYFEGDPEDMMDTIYATRKNVKDKVKQEILEGIVDEEYKLRRQAKVQQREDKREEKRIAKLKDIKYKERLNKESVISWISHEVKNDTLTNGYMRAIYSSYCDFINKNNKTPIIERDFGLLLNNDNNTIPFSLGNKKHTRTGAIMQFDLLTIKKELSENI
jgi:hypothetical protein